jgi:Tfp pilus assembly protein PilO
MSKNLRLILVALVIVVFAILVWFFVLSPIRGEISETEDAIQEEQDLLVTARAKVAAAEATKAEGKINQAKLLELAKMVPSSEELPSLLLQIQDLADQAGISFLTITPGEPTDTESEDYMILPLELEFEEGSYFAVSDFVYRVEQMVGGPGRLLAIKTLELSLQEDEATAAMGEAKLKAVISAYAFIQGNTGATTGGSGSSGTTTTSTTATTSEQ